MTNTTTKSDALIADLHRAYRDEFARSPELQAEFLSAEDYAAYMCAVNSGRVKIMADNVEAIENEAAMRRAEKAGRVRNLH